MAVVAVVFSQRPAAADFIVGGVGNDNLFPFGTSTFYTGEYQQLYASSLFPGPFTITGLGFASVKIQSPGSETLNLTVGLSTSASSLSAPSGTYASNEGADFTTVFNGPITFTGLNNGTFDLMIPVTPFHYDPSKGNLLLDVVAGSSSGAGIASFAFGPINTVSRIYNTGGIPGPTTVGVGEGLLTLIITAAVPEPSSITALAIGAVCVVGWIHRSRIHRGAGSAVASDR
jgi:hypothetical protein